MRKNNDKYLFTAIVLLLLFILWTAAVRWVDVHPIGPNGSVVGFATLNRWVHSLTGVHMPLYTLTDWLGLVPIGTALGFAVLGLCQWIGRGRILKVERSILLLGGFYILVLAVYLLFEICVVNYRPVLIAGYLEASYPSSTTMLVLTVMPTAMMQLNARVKNSRVKKCLQLLLTVFIAFMVIGRFLSGVHWFTDIFGGVLLSAGLVKLYRWCCEVCLKFS